MKKYILLIVILITLISLGIFWYLKSANPQSVVPVGTNQVSAIKPYTPELSLGKINSFKKDLPYSDERFSVGWSNQSNQIQAVIYKPYAENSLALLNWLEDHKISNLPPGMLKIARQ
jgi:hypothetical protein